MALVDVQINDERVAVVTLNDPERRNVLTVAASDELFDAFDALEADDAVGAVVITGAGRAYCAGADLSQLGDHPDGAGLRRIYRGFLRVAQSPLPTVAAVNGPAVGAGMNLALCCDVCVAGASARFDTRFLALGLHPGGGHTWMLNRLAGPSTAAAMVLFGEILSGPEAERAGLVWRCLPDDELLATATTLAARAAAAPGALARRVKATLQEVAALDRHEDAVDVELVHQLWSMAEPEFAARLAALRAKISGQ